MATAPDTGITGRLRSTGGHTRRRRMLRPSPVTVARVHPAGEGDGGASTTTHPSICPC
jgi:hypothetical protein